MTDIICFLKFIILGMLVVSTYGGHKCFLRRKQLKKCDKEGLISGIKFSTTNGIRPTRIYSCENSSQVLNIPASSEFACCLNSTDAKYRWHSVRNVSLVADITTLQCQEKSQCPIPPNPGENMVVNEISRYMRRIRYDNANHEQQNYYEGDTLEYVCKPGFESVTNTSEPDYPDDVYSIVSQTTCNSSGTWDYIDVVDCQAIFCNASFYENITNGEIWNYTDIYEYGESMELVCDAGFETKDHVYSVRCEHSGSFDPYFLPNFQCIAIQCPVPSAILNGDPPFYIDRLVNSTVTFGCNPGYTLSGQETWRCKENGKWDGFCARCNSEDTYCPAPCLPEGAILLNPLPTYQVGDVINFTCSEEMPYAASVSRSCLRNRLWSEESINCMGGSVDISNLVAKLRNISEDKNETEHDGVQGKTIDVGQAGGVDVFLMVDVSGSINDNEFDSTKRFIQELLPPLKISKTPHGTRLALYMFATDVTSIHYDHDYGDWSEQDWKNKVDDIDRDKVKKVTHSGTGFDKALQVIQDELLTKQIQWKDNIGRHSQQALVIISDGLNNQGGNIGALASKLKGGTFQLEIVSICIQFDEKRKKSGIELMREIASHPKSEHFFHLSNNQEDMNAIIKAMIRTKYFCSDCGCTKPELTKYRTNNHSQKARKGAWPWMVQLKSKKGIHLCGASIIKPNWLLTAAHCVDNDQLGGIDINRWKTNDNRDVEHRVDFDVKLHEKYNKEKKPEFLYDIALIKVEPEIEYTSDIHAVCLNVSEKFYGEVFKDDDERYGVVTGWGREKTKGKFADHMKQMTMKIQSNKTCIDMMNASKKNDSYDFSLMFCAGGKDTDGSIIDTCLGDSGGPFSVEYSDDQPGNENRFVQIGIVSFGIVPGKCRENGIYGVYTKITPELRKWIEDETEE